MGLDMYLELRKNDYRSKYYKDKGCKMKLEYPKDITEFIPNPADLRISRQTNYEVVYEGELDYPEMPNALEELFDIFNVRRPNDFKGRSMAVSDIVEVEGKNYYCDAIGWVELK